jgi:hypothetical protein
MTDKVYQQRQYWNALILYKPLPYFRGRAGTDADNTATTRYLHVQLMHGVERFADSGI